MKFCSQCDNMYYLNLSNDDPNKLCFYCRNCGFVDNDIDQQSVSVVLNTTNSRALDFSHIINPYTKYDPTLPSLEGGVCPNEKCGKTNVLYMRYDDENMKFLYICKDCDHVWK